MSADDVVKRMNYFDRQFLHPQDFRDEQAYHIDRRRRHNRALHQWGVAIGMEVKSSIRDPVNVTITEGTAIDENGVEIILPQDHLEPVLKDRAGRPRPNGQYYLFVFYYDQETEERTEGGVAGSTRVLEGADFAILSLEDINNDPKKIRPGYVRLAALEIKDRSFFIDQKARQGAGVNLSGDVEAYKLTLTPYPPDQLPLNQRPNLTCSGEKEAALEGGLKIKGNVAVTSGGPAALVVTYDGSSNEDIHDNRYAAIFMAPPRPLAAAAPFAKLYAAFFDGYVEVDGDLHITGSLTGPSGKSFLIDHPVVPYEKTLRHTAVESPEELCLYRGKIKLDGAGQAKVRLPDYFASLTKEEEATVTLTSIGPKPFPAGYEWSPDFTEFTIYGEADHEVSYLVLAERDDPAARLLRRPVEEEKGDGTFQKGKLVCPQAYGQPAEKPMFLDKKPM